MSNINKNNNKIFTRANMSGFLRTSYVFCHLISMTISTIFIPQMRRQSILYFQNGRRVSNTFVTLFEMS